MAAPKNDYVSASTRVARLVQNTTLEPYVKGTNKYDESTRNRLVEAYFQNKCCLAAACREVGVNYAAALRWKKLYKDFQEALLTAEALMKDLAHQEFMDRVFDSTQKHPAYLLFFLKSQDPRYQQKVQKKTVSIVIEDRTFGLKPVDVIDTDVIREELALPSEYQARD